MKQLVLLCCFAMSTALAQQATPPGGIADNPMVGVWQTSIPTDGGPAIDGIFRFNPDGTYREEMISQGQLLAFWEGRYDLAPDGTLTQHETNKSPQICFRNQCGSNDGPPVTVSRVSAQSSSSITLTYTDESGSYPITLQRVNAGSGPTFMQPTQPGGPSPNPLGAESEPTPWMGSYSDGDLTLHLGSPEGDFLERGDVRYPLELSGTSERLEGSFNSGDMTFPVVLERAEGGVVLTSGDLRFTLSPVTPDGPAQPTNPLGN